MDKDILRLIAGFSTSSKYSYFKCEMPCEEFDKKIAKLNQTMCYIIFFLILFFL